MGNKVCLIFGASGLVGSAMSGRMSRNFYVAAPGHEGADISDAKAVQSLIDAQRPELVILCAALTHVDYCEENPDKSNSVNVSGTDNVVQACRDVCKVVFFSSSYVFGGESDRSYLPTDGCNPINIYGRHKAQAERLVLNAGPKNLVVRTVGVFGKESKQKNFAYQIIGASKADRAVYVPIDQEMNPIHSDDLASIVAQLIEHDESGIHHVAGATCVSKYELAVEIAKACGCSTNKIIGIMTDGMKQSAKRPLNGCLDPIKLGRLNIAAPDLPSMISKFANDH